MAFEYFIGARYLRARQKQTFITLITFLSVAGITVGVMALIVVMAVMTGFDVDLRTRILGGQSHVVLKHREGALGDYLRIAGEVEKIAGVEAATPFNNVPGILRSKSGISPAMIKGIHPESAGRVIETLKDISFPDTSKSTEADDGTSALPAIVLAKELAARLRVMKGDIISLISPGGMQSNIIQMPVMKQFTVSGFFQTGMYEFDTSFAFIRLKDAQKVMRIGDRVTGIEVRVRDIYEARKIAGRIGAELGSSYRTQDWIQSNQKLFSGNENGKKGYVHYPIPDDSGGRVQHCQRPYHDGYRKKEGYRHPKSNGCHE